MRVHNQSVVSCSLYTSDGARTKCQWT